MKRYNLNGDSNIKQYIIYYINNKKEVATEKILKYKLREEKDCNIIGYKLLN